MLRYVDPCGERFPKDNYNGGSEVSDSLVDMLVASGFDSVEAWAKDGTAPAEGVVGTAPEGIGEWATQTRAAIEALDDETLAWVTLVGMMETARHADDPCAQLLLVLLMDECAKRGELTLGGES